MLQRVRTAKYLKILTLWNIISEIIFFLASTAVYLNGIMDFKSYNPFILDRILKKIRNWSNIIQRSQV